MENGSASTTWSAVTAVVPEPFLKVSAYVPPAFFFTATSSVPVAIWPGRACAMRSVSWSLPPATWYFSFDGPKMRSWPWPE